MSGVREELVGATSTRRGFLQGAALAGGMVLLPWSGVRAAAGAMPVAAPGDPLRLGHAVHAFEHLGAYAGQAEAAAASGATIIYATGMGGAGYTGLPGGDALNQQLEEVRAYNANARAKGIEIVLGYLCATSIVKLETFDAGWTEEMRAAFGSGPAAWLQQGRDGQPLPSWYGGDYRPACMNHPGWRAYQRHMVRMQLETGHDGIFFDNPTVHPEGCYCAHCMAGFAAFLGRDSATPLEEMRLLAESQRQDFLRYRATIARDFLGHIREYARTLHAAALITANNSTNQPTVLYSQCRSYGYSPFEMSRTEDFVVLEDMATQPRTKDEGKVYEYAPTYKQAQALCHGKPLVAVTIAEGDYHTPPNLVQLAFAEAYAHGASYLVWTTWLEEQRKRMIAATRACVDFYRPRQQLLQGARPVSDVLVFLPMRRFVETETCVVSEYCAGLSRENVQYTVCSEEDLAIALSNAQVLLLESEAVLTGGEGGELVAFKRRGGLVVSGEKNGWLKQVQRAIDAPAVRLAGPPTVRATLNRQDKRLVLHVLNLDVRRVSSFEDVVHPAEGVSVAVRGVDDSRETAVVHLLGEESVTLPLEREGEYRRIVLPRVGIAAVVEL